MNRRSCICFLLVILILLSSCRKSISIDAMEQFDYHSGSVRISYPQIENPNKSEHIDAVNRLIKEQALSILKGIEQNAYTIDLNYKVNYFDDDFLSISYMGYGHENGAAYPVNVFYTANIDLKDTNLVRLGDITSDYQTIAQIILRYPSSGDQKEAVDYVKNMYSSADLVSMLQNSDDYAKGFFEKDAGVYSYFTKDHISVVIPVIHAAGDYVVFEIPKSEIAVKDPDAVSS